MQYFIEIDRRDALYTGTIFRENRQSVRPLENVSLGPKTEIPLTNRSLSIHELIQQLGSGYSFHEREQLQIGQYLYTQLFGDRRYYDYGDENEEVDIRIVTQDEHLARLPWVLLADKGIFLSTIGWSVVLSGNTETRACELPSSPEMLIVAPQAEDYGDTQADTHLERLEERLSAGDRRLSFGQRLQRVASWEEFVHAAQNSTPQIVYYYGHGGGDSDSSKLVFTNGKTRQGHLIPAADFAVYLRRMEIPPTLVYVNCCQGDTGGLLGIGRQLEDFVPAVLTNRTLASVETAQAQAIAFWENVLLKGVAPHKAVTALYGNLGELNITTADTRWMTPVFYGHYESWTANPPRPLHRLEHDPHWHLKIDRVSQFGTVSLLTRQMLRERKPRSLAFVWYGQAGQGIEIFHQRLNVELREDLSDAFVYEVRPAWPLELANYHHSFKSMMLEVFEVDSLEEIPAHIRSKTRGTFGKQTLLYVRHQPVTSTKAINPKTLKSYLEWWNALFIPLLRGTQTHALLGVSFIVKNPPKFRSLILDKERIEDLYLEDTVFRLLDQMEEVALRDLLDFLRTHNIRLPIERRDKVLEQTLEKTAGHYEKTIVELKNLVERAWDVNEEDEHAAEQLEEEYDY